MECKKKIARDLINLGSYLTFKYNQLFSLLNFSYNERLLNIIFF